MKKILYLCATALLLSFAACSEKDNENGNSNGNPTPSGLAGQLIGTWQSEHLFVNDEEVNAQLTIVMNTDGTGTISERNDEFTWVVSGNNVVVTNPYGNTFTYTVLNITEDGFVISGNYIPGHEEQVSFEGYFRRAGGDDPGDNPDPGDLGISEPELVQNTAHSITVSAHITGSVDQYLWQFPNYSCGITWCHVNQPSEMEHNKLDCTAQAMGNNGFFECTISGLDEGQEYDVAAWIRLTPNSQPIIGPTHMYSTANGGDNPNDNDTNWINLNSAIAANSTTISVTVTGYFDNNPNGIGVVYGTSSNPTTANNVYNAFEHLNVETGEHDETIQRIMENADGSKTVAVLLNNLQPGTTYYIRGYMQFSSGLPTIYTDEISVTTSAK